MNEASQISESTNSNQNSNNQKSSQEPRRNRGWVAVVVIIFLVICFICVLCFGSFIFLGSLDSSATLDSSGNVDIERITVAGDEDSDNQILSIPITGPIYADETLDGIGGGLFGVAGVTYGYQVKDQLIKAASDDSISGVILEINSPGGTINGSKAISDGIEQYKEISGNPVVAYCSSVCASGSYWAAVSADNIIADSGSVVGSVGVIYGPFKFYDQVLAEGDLLNGGVLTENGIDTRYFTAGEFKDSGNPYRQLTQKEIDVYQDSINNEYDNFVQHVISNREDITESQLRNEIGALTYDNKQAMEYGLIDQVGSQTIAYEDIAKRASVESSYRIIRESEVLGFLDFFLGVYSGELKTAETNQINKVNAKLEDFGIVPLYFYHSN